MNLLQYYSKAQQKRIIEKLNEIKKKEVIETKKRNEAFNKYKTWFAKKLEIEKEQEIQNYKKRNNINEILDGEKLNKRVNSVYNKDNIYSINNFQDTNKWVEPTSIILKKNVETLENQVKIDSNKLKNYDDEDNIGKENDYGDVESNKNGIGEGKEYGNVESNKNGIGEGRDYENVKSSRNTIGEEIGCGVGNDYGNGEGKEYAYSKGNSKNKQNYELDNKSTIKKEQIIETKFKDINELYFKYLECNYFCEKPSTPVLEERVNFFLGLRTISAGLSTLIEGKSQSGKSLLMDKIKGLLPDYVNISGSTNNGIMDLSEEINDKKYLIFHEYQAVVDENPRIKEATKCITENYDFKITSKGKKIRLNGDITVLGTSADENKSTKSRDVEVTSRFMILNTILDDAKKKRICEYQNGIEACTIEDIKLTNDEFDYLKDHFTRIIDSRKINFENPFVHAYSNYLPQTQKSIHYRNLFFSLIKSCANFNQESHVIKNNGNLIINLEEMYLIHNYYHDNFCKTLERLTHNTYNSLLKNKSGQTKQELENEYKTELEIIVNSKNKEIDWEMVWNKGLHLMGEKNPEYLLDWVEKQSKAGEVQVYDPIIQKKIKICDLS
jgi:hypothetical protein